MRMLRYTYLILLFLFANTHLLLSQNTQIDSLTRKKFPLIIGNIGFATDSMDIVVGDVPRGEITVFRIEIRNFGKDPVMFTNGKSSRFVTLNFEPELLIPSKEGIINVEFNADIELNLGKFVSEISIVSNDKKSPYKFLNLLMNLIEGGRSINYKDIFDTVPNMVFDHYNYDFGHLVRGKILYHTFLISNLGSMPLNIFEIKLPKGIKVVDSPANPILQDEKAMLRIRINTHGRIGIQHETIVVRSNDPDNPLVILGIHGSVRIYPNHKKTSVQCNE
ncbi:MAG: DUF1573 domain-containing protein [Bacteroidetes bacterium]|nr:DUF1573 domain-containing protein [Bacteroidota bacterium]MBL6942989.1 DUF1573 domain-containing protein [Bacteroidales bacterium]